MSNQLDIPTNHADAVERLGEMQSRLTRFRAAFTGLDLLSDPFTAALYSHANRHQKAAMEAFDGLLHLLGPELEAIGEELEAISHPSCPLSDVRGRNG